MDRDTMRSITDCSLWASVHQELVPSQVTAAGSCVQVTRPGTTPRGTPNGESGSNNEDRRLAAAARDRANCRRVISIFDLLLSAKNLTAPTGQLPEAAETAVVASPPGRPSFEIVRCIRRRPRTVQRIVPDNATEFSFWHCRT